MKTDCSAEEVKGLRPERLKTVLDSETVAILLSWFQIPGLMLDMKCCRRKVIGT